MWIDMSQLEDIRSRMVRSVLTTYTLMNVNLNVKNSLKLTLTKGGNHKSWAHGLKCKAHQNLGENAIIWA